MHRDVAFSWFNSSLFAPLDMVGKKERFFAFFRSQKMKGIQALLDNRDSLQHEKANFFTVIQRCKAKRLLGDVTFLSGWVHCTVHSMQPIGLKCGLACTHTSSLRL